MKKISQLDTRGFLLMETLLVSLTIAGILLYMYVQYSRVRDSHHRLSHYNSVEKLYRAGNLKRLLMVNDIETFCARVDSANGIYKLNYNDFTSNAQNNPLPNLDIESAYVVKGQSDLTKVDLSFGPFLKTVPREENNTYWIIIKYKDGEYAAIILKGENHDEE